MGGILDSFDLDQVAALSPSQVGQMVMMVIVWCLLILFARGGKVGYRFAKAKWRKEPPAPVEPKPFSIFAKRILDLIADDGSWTVKDLSIDGETESVLQRKIPDGTSQLRLSRTGPDIWVDDRLVGSDMLTPEEREAVSERAIQVKRRIKEREDRKAFGLKPLPLETDEMNDVHTVLAMARTAALMSHQSDLMGRVGEAVANPAQPDKPVTGWITLQVRSAATPNTVLPAMTPRYYVDPRRKVAIAVGEDCMVRFEGSWYSVYSYYTPGTVGFDTDLARSIGRPKV